MRGSSGTKSEHLQEGAAIMWFMGIDMGTSGCKAVVFDEHWNIACQAYREYPMHFPGEGLLELDAELVW